MRKGVHGRDSSVRGRAWHSGYVSHRMYCTGCTPTEGRSVNAQEESDHKAPDNEAPPTQQIQQRYLRDLVYVIGLPKPVVELGGLLVEPREVGFILLARLHVVVGGHDGLRHLLKNPLLLEEPPGMGSPEPLRKALLELGVGLDEGGWGWGLRAAYSSNVPPVECADPRECPRICGATCGSWPTISDCPACLRRRNTR